MKTENLDENGKRLETAIEFLKSLPSNNYKLLNEAEREKGNSKIIQDDIAMQFANRFRQHKDKNVTIPISWAFDKQALLNLLGITKQEGYDEVNGIRFYAGVNDAGQLTLIAVSTTKCKVSGCEDCNDDLTVDDEYPYYDYADPCPNNCSSSGSLSLKQTELKLLEFSRVN